MNQLDLWCADIVSKNRWFLNFKLGMGKNALSESDWRILKSAIFKKKLMNPLDLWHADIDTRNIKDCL